MLKVCRYLVLLAAIYVPFSPAHAAEFGLYGFDVRAGVVVPTDWDTGFLVGGSVNVGELLDGLYLYPAVTYSTAEDSFAGIDLEVTDLSLGAEVRYFPAGDPTGWYFGGGPYIHFLEREVGVFFPGPIPGRGFNTIDGEEIGPTAVGGYQFGADGGLLLEARYSVVSGYDTLQVLAGYSF